MYLPMAGSMRCLLRIATLLFAVGTSASSLDAQVARVTPPSGHATWTAWLGCWAPQGPSAAISANESSVTCIVPVDGAHAVEEVTLLADTVIARKRWPLPAAGPQPFVDQECRGREAMNWSASGRRAYVHAEYTCDDGGRGTSATLLAFSQSGVWLRVNEVRADGGAVVTVDRMHEVPAPAGLPAVATRSITQQRRAIATARAAASAPIAVDEIVDALDALDSNVVSLWLIASEQRFVLTAKEAALLAGANLPARVLQAVLGGTSAPREARSVPTGETVFATAAGYVVSSYSGPSAVYICQPYACLTTPPYPVIYPVPVYPAYGTYGYPYYYGYSSSYYHHRPIIRYGAPQRPMHTAPVTISRPIATPQPRPRAPYVYRRP